jgi:hypothetical protein
MEYKIITIKYTIITTIYNIGMIYTQISRYSDQVFLHSYKKSISYNQRLSRACIVHLVIKKNNWSYVKTMSCSGSHLEITINIKNTKFVKDLPLGQLKPNCPGMIIGRSSTKFLFVMPIGNPRWLPPQVIVLTQDHMAKNVKFVEDHPMNIHVQFGFNHICSF